MEGYDGKGGSDPFSFTIGRGEVIKGYVICRNHPWILLAKRLTRCAAAGRSAFLTCVWATNGTAHTAAQQVVVWIRRHSNLLLDLVN